MNVRSPSPDEAAEVAALLSAADAVHGDVEGTSAANVLDDWRLLDLERDAWVWEADGRLAAYAELVARDDVLRADGYVHPDFVGRGLGAAIAETTEGAARDRGATRLRNAVLAADRGACALLEARGYHDVRHFYRMEIVLEAPPPAPEWPPGIAVEPFDQADARVLHAAIQEGFADEWDFRPESFEDSSRRRLESERLDPSLWWIARDGDRIAGLAVCDWKRSGEAGWIGGLAVLKPWRRRGLGLALLHQAFVEFYRRGERVVRLGVDAANSAGATRLYERVGMDVAWEAVFYEKELA